MFDLSSIVRSEAHAFDVLTVRFDREGHADPLVVDLRVDRLPTHPGVDWDRARDAGATPRRPSSFVAMIGSGRPRPLKVHVRFLRFPTLATWDVWAQSPVPSILPGVARKTFFEPNPGCISEELAFDVDASRLPHTGVGRHDIEWRWYGQCRHPGTGQPEGPIEPLGVTRFVLFVVLGRPTSAPWRQLPDVNPDRDLPDPEMLALACENGRGATTLPEAAALVTHAVRALGSTRRTAEGKRRFVYGASDDLVCSHEHHTFLRSAFMQAVHGSSSEPHLRVSCEDLATVVCVIANALGCDLERRKITLPGSTLPIARVRLIGEDPSQPDNWANHIVAWSPTLEGVFDACVQLDLDDRPTGDRWSTPAGMPFGERSNEPAERGYRHRLLTENAGQCGFRRLSEPTLDRQSVLLRRDAGPFTEQRDAYLRAMPVLPVSTLPLAYPLHIPLVLFDGALFEAIPAAFASRGWRAIGAWALRADSRYRVTLVGELVTDAESARALAAWKLTFFREQLTPRHEPLLGAIVYCTRDDRDALIVTSNAIFRFESPGRASLQQLVANLATFVGPR
jgi:hypothetical protein